MGGLPGRLLLPLGRGRGMPRPYKQPGGKQLYRQSTRLRQVCRGRTVASRGGYPVGCIVRMVATGGIYAAPTEYP